MSKANSVTNAPKAPKPSIHLDFDGNQAEVKGVAVGDTITVAIRGVVKGVEQRESWDDPKKMMASITLRDFEVKVGGSKSDIFDALEDEPGE